MNIAQKNLILVVFVLLLAIVPLAIKGGAEFGGADGQAEEAITEMHPDYEPWFQSVWEPPSGEIEGLLFALQAAIGTGFICYYFGYMRGKKQQEREKSV